MPPKKGTPWCESSEEGNLTPKEKAGNLPEDSTRQLRFANEEELIPRGTEAGALQAKSPTYPKVLCRRRHNLTGMGACGVGWGRGSD